MKKTVRYISMGIVIIVVAFLLVYFVPKMTKYQRIPEGIPLQNPELKGPSPIDFMEVNLTLENGIQIEQGDYKQNVYELSFEFLNEALTESLTLASEDVEFVCLGDAPIEGQDRIWEISIEDLKNNRYGIRYQIETDEVSVLPLYLYVKQNFNHGGYNMFEAELDIESDSSVSVMAWRKYSYSMASWATYYPDIESLVAESELIAVIEIVGCSDKAARTQVKVIDALYGCKRDETFAIQQTGTVIDSFKQEVYDDPLLDIGKQYVIFARRNGNGTVTILGGPQGRFCFEEGKVNSLNYGVLRMRLLKNTYVLSMDFKDVDYDKLCEQIENALEIK